MERADSSSLTALHTSTSSSAAAPAASSRSADDARSYEGGASLSNSSGVGGAEGGFVSSRSTRNTSITTCTTGSTTANASATAAAELQYQQQQQQQPHTRHHDVVKRVLERRRQSAEYHYHQQHPHLQQQQQQHLQITTTSVEAATPAAAAAAVGGEIHGEAATAVLTAAERFHKSTNNDACNNAGGTTGRSHANQQQHPYIHSSSGVHFSENSAVASSTQSTRENCIRAVMGAALVDADTLKAWLEEATTMIVCCKSNHPNTINMRSSSGGSHHHNHHHHHHSPLTHHYSHSSNNNSNRSFTAGGATSASDDPLGLEQTALHNGSASLSLSIGSRAPYVFNTPVVAVVPSLISTYTVGTPLSASAVTPSSILTILPTTSVNAAAAAITVPTAVATTTATSFLSSMAAVVEVDDSGSGNVGGSSAGGGGGGREACSGLLSDTDTIMLAHVGGCYTTEFSRYQQHRLWTRLSHKMKELEKKLFFLSVNLLGVSAETCRARYERTRDLQRVLCRREGSYPSGVSRTRLPDMSRSYSYPYYSGNHNHTSSGSVKVCQDPGDAVGEEPRLCVSARRTKSSSDCNVFTAIDVSSSPLGTSEPTFSTVGFSAMAHTHSSSSSSSSNHDHHRNDNTNPHHHFYAYYHTNSNSSSNSSSSSCSRGSGSDLINSSTDAKATTASTNGAGGVGGSGGMSVDSVRLEKKRTLPPLQSRFLSKTPQEQQPPCLQSALPQPPPHSRQLCQWAEEALTRGEQRQRGRKSARAQERGGRRNDDDTQEDAKAEANTNSTGALVKAGEEAFMHGGKEADEGGEGDKDDDKLTRAAMRRQEASLVTKSDVPPDAHNCNCNDDNDDTRSKVKVESADGNPYQAQDLRYDGHVRQSPRKPLGDQQQQQQQKPHSAGSQDHSRDGRKHKGTNITSNADEDDIGGKSSNYDDNVGNHEVGGGGDSDVSFLADMNSSTDLSLSSARVAHQQAQWHNTLPSVIKARGQMILASSAAASSVTTTTSMGTHTTTVSAEGDAITTGNSNTRRRESRSENVEASTDTSGTSGVMLHLENGTSSENVSIAPPYPPLPTVAQRNTSSSTTTHSNNDLSSHFAATSGEVDHKCSTTSFAEAMNSSSFMAMPGLANFTSVPIGGWNASLGNANANAINNNNNCYYIPNPIHAVDLLPHTSSTHSELSNHNSNQRHIHRTTRSGGSERGGGAEEEEWQLYRKRAITISTFDVSTGTPTEVEDEGKDDTKTRMKMNGASERLSCASKTSPQVLPSIEIAAPCMDTYSNTNSNGMTEAVEHVVSSSHMLPREAMTRTTAGGVTTHHLAFRSSTSPVSRISRRSPSSSPSSGVPFSPTQSSEATGFSEESGEKEKQDRDSTTTSAAAAAAVHERVDGGGNAGADHNMGRKGEGVAAPQHGSHFMPQSPTWGSHKDGEEGERKRCQRRAAPLVHPLYAQSQRRVDDTDAEVTFQITTATRAETETAAEEEEQSSDPPVLPDPSSTAVSSASLIRHVAVVGGGDAAARAVQSSPSIAIGTSPFTPSLSFYSAPTSMAVAALMRSTYESGTVLSDGCRGGGGEDNAVVAVAVAPIVTNLSPFPDRFPLNSDKAAPAVDATTTTTTTTAIITAPSSSSSPEMAAATNMNVSQPQEEEEEEEEQRQQLSTMTEAVSQTFIVKSLPRTSSSSSSCSSSSASSTSMSSPVPSSFAAAVTTTAAAKAFATSSEETPPPPPPSSSPLLVHMGNNNSNSCSPGGSLTCGAPLRLPRSFVVAAPLELDGGAAARGGSNDEEGHGGSDGGNGGGAAAAADSGQVVTAERNGKGSTMMASALHSHPLQVRRETAAMALSSSPPSASSPSRRNESSPLVTHAPLSLLPQHVVTVVVRSDNCNASGSLYSTHSSAVSFPSVAVEHTYRLPESFTRLHMQQQQQQQRNEEGIALSSSSPSSFSSWPVSLQAGNTALLRECAETPQRNNHENAVMCHQKGSQDGVDDDDGDGGGVGVAPVATFMPQRMLTESLSFSSAYSPIANKTTMIMMDTASPLRGGVVDYHKNLHLASSPSPILMDDSESPGTARTTAVTTGQTSTHEESAAEKDFGDDDAEEKEAIARGVQPDGGEHVGTSAEHALAMTTTTIGEIHAAGPSNSDDLAIAAAQPESSNTLLSHIASHLERRFSISTTSSARANDGGVPPPDALCDTAGPQTLAGHMGSVVVLSEDSTTCSLTSRNDSGSGYRESVIVGGGGCNIGGGGVGGCVGGAGGPNSAKASSSLRSGNGSTDEQAEDFRSSTSTSPPLRSYVLSAAAAAGTATTNTTNTETKGHVSAAGRAEATSAMLDPATDTHAHHQHYHRQQKEGERQSLVEEAQQLQQQFQPPPLMPSMLSPSVTQHEEVCKEEEEDQKVSAQQSTMKNAAADDADAVAVVLPSMVEALRLEKCHGEDEEKETAADGPAEQSHVGHCDAVHAYIATPCCDDEADARGVAELSKSDEIFVAADAVSAAQPPFFSPPLLQEQRDCCSSDIFNDETLKSRHQTECLVGPFSDQQLPSSPTHHNTTNEVVTADASGMPPPSSEGEDALVTATPAAALTAPAPVPVTEAAVASILPSQATEQSHERGEAAEVTSKEEEKIKEKKMKKDGDKEGDKGRRCRDCGEKAVEKWQGLGSSLDRKDGNAKAETDGVTCLTLPKEKPALTIEGEEKEDSPVALRHEEAAGGPATVAAAAVVGVISGSCQTETNVCCFPTRAVSLTATVEDVEPPQEEEEEEEVQQQQHIHVKAEPMTTVAAAVEMVQELTSPLPPYSYYSVMRHNGMFHADSALFLSSSHYPYNTSTRPAYKPLGAPVARKESDAARSGGGGGGGHSNDGSQRISQENTHRSESPLLSHLGVISSSSSSSAHASSIAAAAAAAQPQRLPQAGQCDRAATVHEDSLTFLVAGGEGCLMDTARTARRSNTGRSAYF